jgi:hypothetical protein
MYKLIHSTETDLLVYDMDELMNSKIVCSLNFANGRIWAEEKGKLIVDLLNNIKKGV